MMKINLDKFIELHCIAENIQDKSLNEEYDELLENGGYSDSWELIDDLVNQILNIPMEKEILEVVTPSEDKPSDSLIIKRFILTLPIDIRRSILHYADLR